MSHSVHYIFPSSCLESDALIKSPLLSGELAADLKKGEFPAESEMTFEQDSVRVAFSVELSFGVLWTDINYSRFLYAKERVRTVDSIDRWLRTWCAMAARVDEFFVNKWFARLEADPP